MANSFIQKVVAAGKAAANHKSGDGKASVASIMVFSNPEFGRIRTSTDEKGEPLFCGKDVCEVLGYRNASDAVNQHVSIHDIAKRYVWVSCGMKADGSPAFRKTLMLFATESGFYSLVFGSKLPIAQRFKLWVTSEVLPQIRKTGGYVPLHEGDTEEDIRQRAEEILRKTIAEKDSLLAEQEKLLHQQCVYLARQKKLIAEQETLLEGKCKLIAEQETEIDRLLPKALYADNVLDSISCYTTTQIAKELGMTAQELNRLLCAERVQYYQSGQYMLYAEYAHQGLAKSRTHFDLYVGRDTVCTRVYLVWTERGRKLIHQMVSKLPLGVFPNQPRFSLS